FVFSSDSYRNCHRSFFLPPDNYQGRSKKSDVRQCQNAHFITGSSEKASNPALERGARCSDGWEHLILPRWQGGRSVQDGKDYNKTEG
ncbi:MAG: hypothetical protein AAGA86_03350, partial [Bacteroidota bacterium]